MGAVTRLKALTLTEIKTFSPQSILRRFINVTITLPKLGTQSKEYTSKSSAPLKNEKTILSIGKVLATVFWDSHLIILVNYLEEGKAVHGKEKNCFFHQDNTPAHKSAIAMAKIEEIRCQLLVVLFPRYGS